MARKIAPPFDDLAAQCRYSEAEIALRLHMTTRHVRRLFRKQSEEKLAAWLRRKKLERAAEELRKGKGIKDVIRLLGYYQSAHFIRDFKKAFGMTPRTFTKDQCPLLDAFSSRRQEPTSYPHDGLGI